MSNRFFLGNLAGVGRVRTARLGYDVTDPALDPRYLTFDSTWVNTLRLTACGEVAGSSLTSGSVTYPTWSGFSAGAFRDVKRLTMTGSGPDRPTMAFVKNYGGNISIAYAGTPVANPPVVTPYARGYGVCGVSMVSGEIYLSPRRDDLNYVYYTFGANPTAAETAGANSSLFGNHPTYGPGLFVARPGFNALTASLSDMALSSRSNHFQFAETGTVMLNNVSGAGLWTSDLVSTDTFYPNPATVRNCRIVTLADSYPDYPPVSMFWNDAARSEHIGSCYWLAPNQICLVGFKDTSSICRFGVIATDPSYTGGIDGSTGIRRCYASPATGFGVTKHNVDALSAGANDWIFRSDRITPYFNAFEAFYAGRASGTYSLPTPAPAGIPFGFMMTYDPFSGWWCGVGNTSNYHVYVTSTVSTTYGPIFQGYITNNSQYSWIWDPAWTSSVTTGYMATTNVSDF